MAWIRTVKEADASGPLKTEYENAIRRAGRVFEILKIQSLKPEYISACIALYQKAMFGPSRLTRAQREMMAVVVSVANRCHY
jgi:alkylhydroperoxidase family enzyme